MDHKCWKCQTVKPETEFHLNKSTKYGIDCMCKPCRNAYRRKRTNSDKPRGRMPRDPEIGIFNIEGDFVYQIIDKNDKIIYIGSTSGLHRRMRSHKSKSAWWPKKSKTLVYRAKNQAEMMALELSLISKARPKYNKKIPTGSVEVLFDYSFENILSAA